MSAQSDQIVAFIQERCLWQFFSRTWDREENIEGIIDLLGKIIKGQKLALETAADRCFYADAKILVGQLKERYDWIASFSPEQLDDVLTDVKAKLTEITITKSKNAELKIPNY
jgi:V-containing nitrogenase delta subunit